MASFELWDDYVRQPVAWINREICPGQFSDPMDAIAEAQASDPEQETLFEVLSAWQGIFNSRYVSATEVFKAINFDLGPSYGSREPIVLKDALNELNNGNEVTSAKSLGRILGYRRGRIVNGLQLQFKTDTSTNSKIWCVSGVA